VAVNSSLGYLIAVDVELAAKLILLGGEDHLVGARQTESGSVRVFHKDEWVTQTLQALGDGTAFIDADWVFGMTEALRRRIQQGNS
jgi:hypothetical protein